MRPVIILDSLVGRRGQHRFVLPGLEQKVSFQALGPYIPPVLLGRTKTGSQPQPVISNLQLVLRLAARIETGLPASPTRTNKASVLNSTV
jgi:hypothetical protein